MLSRKYQFLLKVGIIIKSVFAITAVYSQANYHPITLPKTISGVNEEFSGMAIWCNRLYLEPQYGSHKETKLDGDFNIYSISNDSISRVIHGNDTELTAFKILKVKNLDQLPDSVKKHYEGFEAISITGGKVFLSIETNDAYDYCFLLKGAIDTLKNEIKIDPKHFISLKRYPYIINAGFESLAYLPKQDKLIAMYEYNAMPDGGLGFLIDTSFRKAPEPIKTPFLYFRITDIAATQKDKIYGINYFWSGNYDKYLNNNFLRNQEEVLKSAIPDLKDSLNHERNYLKMKSTSYARIVSLNNYRDKQWKQVVSFMSDKNNWEGLVLFDKGALVITDANRSSKQLTTLAYIDF